MLGQFCARPDYSSAPSRRRSSSEATDSLWMSSSMAATALPVAAEPVFCRVYGQDDGKQAL